MLRKILYYLIGCIIVGVILSAIFSSLPVYKFVAEGFMVSVSKGEYKQAYAMLSKEFQARYDLPAFIANIEKSGLNDYQRTIWKAESSAPDKKHGVLYGIVYTKHNVEIPIEFNFVVVDGPSMADRGWRIDNIIIKQKTEAAPTQ
ncbi:MAG: hypothetical protein HYX61_02215 [Gammaproteobacteria bacterium]|jgi:hypothetical protein|nr:hypothetical protein [Gammaproteobacteria bacterium]